MRTSIFSSAVLLAAANAVNLESRNYPTVTYFSDPISPFIHSIYCNVYGEDPRFPPCDRIDYDDLAPYRRLSANRSKSAEKESEPEPVKEESADEPDEETNNHKGDPDYKKDFVKLYPFSNVSFVEKEEHDGEFVETTSSDVHYYATPQECDPCAELR